MAYLSSLTQAAGQHLRLRFDTAMARLGWIEGNTLIADRRYAESDLTRVAPLTAELLALKPDVFVTDTDLEARPAAAATKTVPIVFIVGFDPVGLGLVKSLASPGGNVTGFSVLNDELNPKRLSLLKEAVPRADKMGVLFRESDARSEAVLKALEKSGRQIGIALVPVGIRGAEDIEGAFARIANSGATAVLNIPDILFFQRRKQLADLAIKHRLAAAFAATDYADAGALLAYGANYGAVVERAAALVDRILSGANPAMIPVEQPNVYDLVINLRTARTLGIELPRSLMMRATRVIE
jgi:putative ABC transport system substrate-binding protein